ncbi:MAG TPA: hypothetical protein VER96_20885 [Polyangiaceae bacterium]|nr:hypothetical protein [Polyangiaceae bacterium]
MPNPETTPDDARVPSHSCISLDDINQPRTSSIDAGWDTLSVVPAEEDLLPTVSARPRFETLPGLGPDSDLAVAPKPRRARRAPLGEFVLRAMLVLTLAAAVVVTWRNTSVFFEQAALVPILQSNLVAVASQPVASPVAFVAPPLATAVALVAEPPVPASNVELPPAKPASQGKPLPRAVPAVRVATAAPAQKFSTASNYRSRQTLSTTDNPY